MSEARPGEEAQGEVENRSESGSGSGEFKRDAADAGGKRDSGASSGSEGSHQQQQQSTSLQQSSAQGQGSRGQDQGQSHDDAVGKDVVVAQRHVEASPQGRYLRFEEKLGAGQYKVVYRAYDTWAGIEVAWNAVNIKNLPWEEKKRIMNEVRLLNDLEHKNLVQYHGSWVNRDKEEVIVVTEIMQSGSLMDFIRKVAMIRWRVVKRWARQILRGMNYLHSQDPPVIHRDLKCDNIFINSALGDIRIGDLGLSTSNTRSEKTMSVLGTPEFMAPELYEESYTEKVDIYAFGMCMLEMVTRERPYSECGNPAQIFRKVTSQILPSALERVQNARAREFVRVCLSPDPDDRPSAAELLNFAFLKDKNEQEDNDFVTLDPLVAEGQGQALDVATTAGTPVPGGANPTPKIDPTLPGVSHPALKGTPELDTIVEAPVTASSHNIGAIHGVPQVPTPTAIPKGRTVDLPPAVAPVHGDSGSPGQGETGSGGGNGSGSRKPTYYSALMSDSVGSDTVEAAKDPSASVDGGSVDTPGRMADPPTQPASGWKGESGERLPDADGLSHWGRKIPDNPTFESDEDEDEQKDDISHPEGFLRAMPEDESAMRVLKLPEGRTRRRGEDDDDEEAGSQDDEEAGAEDDISPHEEETHPPHQTAPSSAQAPPLASGPGQEHSAPVKPPPSGPAPQPPQGSASRPQAGAASAATAGAAAAAATAAVPLVPRLPGRTAAHAAAGPAIQAPRPPTTSVVHTTSQPAAAPVGQAPRPPVSGAQTPGGLLVAGLRPPAYAGPAGAAPAVQAPRPPIADTTVFLSGGGSRPRMPRSGGMTVGVMALKGASTPGTMSPPGVTTGLVAAHTSTFHAVSGDVTTNLATAAAFAALASDPGLMSPTVGPAIPVQRARSFSRVEHVPSAGVLVPAARGPPALPAPRPPIVSTDADAAAPGVRISENPSADVVGIGNGLGPVLPSSHDAATDRHPPSAQQVDHELHDRFSSRGGPVAPTSQTDIKIANLQGPEQAIMRLVMHTHIEGRLQEVEFDFNLEEDHPDQVSAEMIRELGLSDKELGPISVTITNLAEKARKRRMRRSSSNSSVTTGQDAEGGNSSTLATCGSDINLAAGGNRGGQSLRTIMARQGSGGVAPVASGGTADASDGVDAETIGHLAGGADDGTSDDDDVDIEEDDEFRRTKLLFDKKKRHAEKVFETRLAALLAARNNRTDEHKRAQERYKKDCDDFDKKVEKLRSEKERRMEECSDELRGLEDGYRQRHRDAKQAKRHSSAAGSIAAHVNMMSVAQPPREAAPTPQVYAQRQSMGALVSGHIHASLASDGNHLHGHTMMDAGSDDVHLSPTEHHPVNMSQYNSVDGHVGTASARNNNSHDLPVVAVPPVAPPTQQQGGAPLTTAEEEAESARRDRLSTL